MTFVATCREILDVKSSKNQGRPAGFRKHNPPEAKLVKDSSEDGALDLETGNQTGGQMRGDTSSVEVRPDNFIMVFGCQTGLGISAETKMVLDIATAIRDRTDESKLVSFPAALDSLKTGDTNIEVIKTSNCQTV